MVSVILCAAGGGSRAGFSENKILREFLGLPVLCHSLSAFAPYADEIIVPCRKEDRERVFALLSPFPSARLVEGGATRMESVFSALNTVKGDIVLVHDAARPFVSDRIIADCLSSVKSYGSGVCALPAIDTIGRYEGNRILSHPPRSQICSIQTPQGFQTEQLLCAYRRAFLDGRTDFTDDSSVYAAYCEPPRLFFGESENRKLTFPEDFRLAERAGFGIDTHRFGKPQNFMILGGVHIPSPEGLIAHSDGDVLCHALMDALLSAIGERDIGYHFPDTEERYRDADSMKMLETVMEMVTERGFYVKNVSLSILAERPRLFSFLPDIKENLIAATKCECVGVAAGTNEKLGYVGEGKGITVYALVLLGEK